MKRPNDYDDYYDANVSLPSPQYSEPEHEDLFESPTKRMRESPQIHDLNVLIEDQVLDFVTSRGVTKHKFRSNGKALILVFFGVMKDHLDEIEQSYTTISKSLDTEIIGVSANLSHNEYSFPLINGVSLTKKFNVRDPMGGGVYPRDMLIFFDKYGRQRHQVLLGCNGKRLINKPTDEVIKDVLEEIQGDHVMLY